MRPRFATSGTWIMDAGRNWAAIILFIIWPCAQVFVPRSTPFFFGLAAVVILIARLVAARLGESEATFGNDVRGQLKSLPAMLFFSFLIFMAVSLLWSPLPERGAKDIGVLTAMFFVALFLAPELARVTLLRFESFVLIALTIGSLGLISEAWGLTSLHATFLERNHVYDLNRNAVWLIVLGCAAIGFNRQGERKPAIVGAIGLLVVFAILSSQGESAKFALLVAAPAMLITRFASSLIKPLFLLFAAVLLSMPLLAGFLTDRDGMLHIPTPVGAHAEHRVALWQGYAELVGNNPVFGWGTKADRALGGNKMAAKIAAERGYPELTTSPHNVALEIWVNHGFIGALLAAGILLATGWKIFELPAKIRPPIIGIVTAAFAIGMTGSSFYQGWWITTICAGFVVWSGWVSIMDSSDEKMGGTG